MGFNIETIDHPLRLFDMYIKLYDTMFVPTYVNVS